MALAAFPTTERAASLTAAVFCASRNTAVQGLYLFGIVNGLAGYAIRSVTTDGWIGAASETFDINVVLIAAVAVALGLVARSAARRIDALDITAWSLYIVGVLIPHSGVSWIAVTLLALYEALRGRRSGEAVAAASLILAAAANQLWGVVLIHLFAPYLLAIDAHAAGTVLGFLKGGGVVSSGNLIEPEHGQPLVLITGCSSFYGLSYAFLSWLTVVRLIEPRWRLSHLFWVLLACGAVIVINVFRIAMMGYSTASYFILHGAIGSHVFNVLILLVGGGAGFAALALRPNRRSGAR